jgi:type I restriction enzyme S subunit
MVNGKIIPSQKMQVSEKTKNRLFRYILKEGDFIIARRGEMGRSAIVTKHEDGFLCGTGSFFLDLHSQINREFILQLFQSDLVREYLRSASNGATMSNLNQSILLNMVISLPSVEEQKAIVEKVNGLMALCDQLEQEIETHQTTQEDWMQSCLREVV